MNRFGCAVLGVALVLLALTAPTALADEQDGVVLRWTPKLGDVMVYKMTITGDVRFEGDIPFMPENESFAYSIEAQVRQTVLDVAQNGDVVTQVTYEQLKANMFGQTVDMTSQLSGCEIRLIQTAKGELVGVSGMPQTGGMPGMDTGFGMATYPEGRVTVGTSWRTPIPLPMLGPTEKFEVVSTVTAIDDKNGRKVANIKTTFDGDIDIVKMLSAMPGYSAGPGLPEGAKMDAKFDLTGNTQVRVSDGRVVSADAAGTMAMKSDLASLGACSAYDTGERSEIEVVVNFKIFLKDINAD